MSSDLAAYWKLATDCADSSGNNCHGENHGVVFSPDYGARFDGRGAFITVRDHPALNFGRGDFTLSAWVYTENKLDDVLGDILGKYDPKSRRGINWCIQNFHGVTSGQSNYRNVLFGVDDAHATNWIDCGRPGNNLMVWCLCVYRGDLYAGTFEAGEDEAGHVYRYLGGANWEDCGSPHPSNAITALAVHDDVLYAAASHYRSQGSSLAESENDTEGGRVFRYEGGDSWSDCGKLKGVESIGGLVSFKGKLYASSMYAPAGLFRYDDHQKWTECGAPNGRIEALAVHDGHLYGSGWDEARPGVYRYEGGVKWSDCGAPPNTTQTYSFAQHQGRMYIGTWPSGKVYRYGGGQSWEDCGQLGSEREVMGMAVYNGKLYAGTLPLAEVYRYDGDGDWTRTGQLDTTPDARYRRAWSMAVFQGKLFCGTLPSGHVYAYQAGASVTYDHELEYGWNQITAVRHGAVLRLYINGALAALQTAPDSAVFDVSNAEPLTIGFGAHDYFNGCIREVRAYRRALNEDDIVALCSGDAFSAD